MTKEKEELEALQKALARLQAENTRWRKLVEEAEVVLRRRAPNASGLTLKGSIKTILNQRDANLNRIEFYRDEMKKILRLLIDNKFEDAKKELNLFLFKNKK